MSASLAPPRIPALSLILRASLLENLRRREFYVVLIFMALYFIGAVITVAVGIDNPATGTFLLNLGISLAILFAQLMALLTAVRQIPDDCENRTIYPLLAKPVSRAQYILGRWLAALVTGMGTLAILFVMGWAPVPKMETYETGTLIQMLVLQAGALAAVSALGLLLSLLMPKIVALIVAVLLVMQGDTIGGFVRTRAVGSNAEGIVQWLTGYIPDFAYLNLAMRYTDGLPPLEPGLLAARLAYAIILTGMTLALAMYCFQRRPL